MTGHASFSSNTSARARGTASPRAVSSSPRRLLAAAALVAISIAGAAAANAERLVAVGIVPFEDHTGRADAVESVMAEVRGRLAEKGLVTVGEERVAPFLRARRIRARSTMSADNARELALEMEARYLLFGSISAFDEAQGPHVAVAARLVDPASGGVAWSGSAGLQAVDTPGLLAMRRPRTLEETTRRVTRKLFAGLRVAPDGTILRARHRRPEGRVLGDAPIHFRSDDFDPSRPMRLAVLPFENRSQRPEGSAVVMERLRIRLRSVEGIEVVDPGEFREFLIEKDIQPIWGVGPREMAALRAGLGIDAVLDGTLLAYDNGRALEPRVDVHARLRDAGTGRVLWAATVHRKGDDTRTVYDFGRIRGIEPLVDATLEDLLSTWFRRAKNGKSR